MITEIQRTLEAADALRARNFEKVSDLCFLFTETHGIDNYFSLMVRFSALWQLLPYLRRSENFNDGWNAFFWTTLLEWFFLERFYECIFIQKYKYKYKRPIMQKAFTRKNIYKLKFVRGSISKEIANEMNS